MEKSSDKTEIPATVGEALQYCARHLENSDAYFGHGTDNPWDEAVQLVLTVVGLPLESGDEVLPHAVTRATFDQLSSLLQRRIEDRVPLPYLLKRAWFAGLEFHCDERALVPRSPLGELLQCQFKPWYSGPEPRRILDLCCGGGAIGLACAHYLPQVHVDLLDLQAGALALSRQNAEALGLEQRVSIIQSDLFRAVGQVQYDLILSNPPYVNALDLATMPAEYHHEPPTALGSGSDGLALTHRILASARDYLQPEGLLVVEVGNSWLALESAYPGVPFTWLEFENGGHGVFALSAKELQDCSASFGG
ncbi:MAG: 50S ribosomal protein L3 N(5)-glutamine methyltransferase [Halieaceae bacterium]|jgi:ribosomal protein L3 glutamine methyltransferase|nr:50S ribosomal protein L3 N(5)-glutamine methyltransferase [Halieaceae bacterium]